MSYPKSIPIIDWGVTVAIFVGIRMLHRKYYETRGKQYLRKTRILIVGAGDAGVSILKEIKNNPYTGYEVIGFIDDDVEKIDKRIDNYPVLGNTEQIKKIVYTYKIDEIIIAIPSASGEDINRITTHCKEAKVKFKILPSLGEIIKGKVTLSQIKEVDVLDLLKREPVKLNIPRLKHSLKNKVVMITGAGGTIGGEVARQVAQFDPKELILIDIAETPLFWIDFKLKEIFSYLKIEAILGDIRNTYLLEEIFRTKKPEIIYHAAAYKHVPILEKFPREGVSTNIIGTKNLVNLSIKYNVENFVFISTDKAVEPKSFMGISKCISELYVRGASRNGKTKFVIVRFGNVLDSTGSCLPIFRDQLKRNKPITITHPEAKRFFMTPLEAAQLIVEAGTVGKGGEVFILKMGEAIKIGELVKKFLEFSGGKSPGIVYTGLREGEKLEEKLFWNKEKIKITDDKRIYVINHTEEIKFGEVKKEIEKLEESLYKIKIDDLLEECKKIIHHYYGEYS
jgi:FlaA1/EpsC-like NDP-sugar epimerase